MTLSSEHISLFKKFKKCVDSRTIETMDKKLYHFFMYECGFIAHYNIHGFRSEYHNTDFLRWFNNFAEPNWMFFNGNGTHEELKKACVSYAQDQKFDVYEHFAREERNRKLRLLQSLSAELDMEVVPASSISTKDTKMPPLFLQEEPGGQFSLFS